MQYLEDKDNSISYCIEVKSKLMDLIFQFKSELKVMIQVKQNYFLMMFNWEIWF